MTIKASITAMAAGALLAAVTASTALAQNTIKIAATLPLTGNAATFGQFAKNGADLAVAEMNAAGGAMGKTFAVDIQDNRCNPAEAVKIVTQMASDPSYVAMFDGLCSSVILAAMPVVARSEIPFVVATASATSISDQSGVGGNKWTFKFNPTDDTMAKAMVDWLVKANLGEKIAFLGEDTDFGRSGSGGFKNALSALGKKLIIEDYYQQGTADFSAALTKLKAAQPSAIALYSLSSDQLNIINQMQTFDIRAPLTGRLQTDVMPKEVLAAGRLDGTTSVQPYSPEIDTPENKGFVAAYTAKYGNAPNSIAYSAYEAMRVLCDAIKRAGSTDRAKIREALLKTKYPSLLGGFVEFDDHNLAHNFAVILRIDSGVAKVVGVSKT